MTLDYILFPGMLFVLWLVIQLAINPIKLEMRELAQVLADRTDRDRITGLWNRAALYDALTLALAKPLETAISVICVDVDNYKKTLNALGYDNTELVASDIGRLLTLLFRRAFIARYERDQFMLVLLDCDGTQAQQKAEDVRKEIEVLRFIEIPDLRLTASIGVCDVRGVTERTPKAVLQAVEQAVYMAKRSGKNRVFRGDAFLREFPPPPSWKKR